MGILMSSRSHQRFLVQVRMSFHWRFKIYSLQLNNWTTISFLRIFQRTRPRRSSALLKKKWLSTCSKSLSWIVKEDLLILSNHILSNTIRKNLKLLGWFQPEVQILYHLKIQTTLHLLSIQTAKTNKLRLLKVIKKFSISGKINLITLRWEI